MQALLKLLYVVTKIEIPQENITLVTQMISLFNNDKVSVHLRGLAIIQNILQKQTEQSNFTLISNIYQIFPNFFTDLLSKYLSSD